eukprot:s295_g22.t1
MEEDVKDKRDGSYSPSVAGNAEGHQTAAIETIEDEVPFRALDLLACTTSFRHDVSMSDLNSPPADSDQRDAAAGAEQVEGPDIGALFGDGFSESNLMQFQSDMFSENAYTEQLQSDARDSASDSSVEIVERSEEFVETEVQDSVSSAVAPRQVWNEMVANSFAEFRETSPMLLYPWETGPMADIFNFRQDPLPRCPGIAEVETEASAGDSDNMQVQLGRFLMPDDAKYDHAVKSLQDLNYFDGKSQRLELACGQWLNLLSIQWSASGVGPQLVVTLQTDHTGTEASAILKSCFGVKSPATLLKRANAFRKFVAWFDKQGMATETKAKPFPLDEVMVWHYFLWLKEQREKSTKGFTVPTAFLEAVRFAKFTLDLTGTDTILGSRRLLGFAVLERQAMGPTKQAPGMELEHLRRLHEILGSNANLIDKLGAGCFLLCTYARARWSDVRFVEKVYIEIGEYVTLYRAEHKTASVAIRRQQYLPLVVPWNGVVTDDWMRAFLQIYAAAGLDINREPLGPLLPAPRLDGSFCARPLTTSEAAAWLRGLLQGTGHAETFMKATLLGWCARAGLDKECRAVLGHHCSALNGSEAVYSRQLQIRALRKLEMILRRIRSGQGLEDEAMREHGIISTPAAWTPVGAARTPLPPAPPVSAVAPEAEVVDDFVVVKQAVEEAVEIEELQSVKEEMLDAQIVEAAADKHSLFPVEVVAAGVVEIESSSGSDSSDSSSSESDSSLTEELAKDQPVRFVEHVPQDMDFYKHAKSGIVHGCKLGELRDAGLNATFVESLKRHGVRTLGQLAFAVGQPGQPIQDNSVEQLVQNALGRAPSLQETACVKRAAFEAQTYLTATLRQAVDRSEDSLPRKIPFAERQTRMEALKLGLAGLSISGEHEPAHCLLDRACGMYEANSLKYLDLASCVSRSLESQGTTRNRELTLEKGSLVMKNNDDKLQSATDSEIKVHYAMVRRGLTFQFAKLMSYNQHTEWETFLFEALHREPPPGYSRPSLTQLLQCDKAAFSRLASTLSSIRQRDDGSYPLGSELLDLRSDPMIALYLAPVSKPVHTAGMGSSIAVDKTRKRSARSTILQLDLCNEQHQSLLERWLQSPMLLWVHIAPVCGTASRARNIRRFANDPKPLRSDAEPEGLSNLSPGDAERVRIANQLFEYSCKIFLLACATGTLVTMESPRGSYFWLTCWVPHLLATVDVYCGDFQVCMLGGTRDKWTRIIGNFPDVSSLNIPCNGQHSHEPWGFAKDLDGSQVWATALESKYPKKMCVALVTLVLDFAEGRGLKLRATSILDDTNPLQTSQRSQVSAGNQPKPSKMPPVVSDFCSVASFLVKNLDETPCSLMSKLPHDIVLHTKALQPVTVPQYSRFLRFTSLSAPVQMGVDGGQSASSGNALKRKLDGDEAGFEMEVAFGLPWTHQGLIQQAGKVGHPTMREGGVPYELTIAVEKHVEWSNQQLASARIAWCRKWMKRAQELELEEQQHLSARHPEVARLTSGKRLLLTEEMLADINFEDMSALRLLSEGATLAGEIEASASFGAQYKPCLATLDQLETNASKMNEAVVRMTTSSGDASVDEQLLAETELELAKGWADGPYDLEQLEQGATISRRFPLVQGSKVGMIDDFSISGVNDSCEIHNKLDLHMIDTFCALIKHYFSSCSSAGKVCSLLAKTYDLKSAYRQETLSLRGRLGFADSFLHGRLGKLVLLHLVDHAYGVSKYMDSNLVGSLRAMAERLQASRPRVVSASECRQWFVYTNASYEPESFTGGLGGVLVNETVEVVAWFGICLDENACTLLGAKEKGTIIYELEMLATVLATALWCDEENEDLHVMFGDNDSVRFSLIRACAAGKIASGLIEFQLKLEAKNGLRTLYARVPTEANLNDFPSRSQSHDLLGPALDISGKAVERLQTIFTTLQMHGKER